MRLKNLSRSICRRALLWLPPLLYAALIFYFSSQSDPLPVLTAWVWDKALHGVEYAGLGFLLCRALKGERVGSHASLAFAIVIASAYAASDELHQLFVPERQADILDWVADMFGAGCGAAAYTQLTSLFA